VELHELADDLLTTTGRGDTPFGVYVLESGDPTSALARQVERDVFLEFFGNTVDMLETEYHQYERASTFLCVIDHLRRVPAGMIRLISPSPAGFKTLHDLDSIWGLATSDLARAEQVGLDTSSLWDLATLAVARDYRSGASSGLVSMALYQALNMLGHAHGIRWATAVMDVVVLDLINSAWQRPFTGIPGADPRRYLDSPASMPVFCDVVDYRMRLAFLDPTTHAILFEGRGIESMVSTPRWDSGTEVGSRIAGVG
jgi:hypothetical protein